MSSPDWAAHVQACQQSSLSKLAYAKQHDLVYHQFLYYYNKHNATTSPDFIPVKMWAKRSTQDRLGVVEFPNGIKLVIHSAELLALLLRLLR